MKHIVIVGGGTAGWMAAINLASRFPAKQITVVEPSRLGPIGVGESVTGVVQDFISNPINQLSQQDFFRRSDAMLKLGIWYHDWHGPNTEFLSPIDNPYFLFESSHPEDLEAFYATATMSGASICEEQIHGRLMRAGLTDYYRKPDGTISDDLSTASLQFDALKFTAWLRDVAAERPSIRHLDDSIRTFEQDSETGFITELILESDQRLAGDFFLDCTGFARRLFQPAFQPRWTDYGDYLKVDRAIPIFVEHEEGELPVCTSATALPHGWIWRVPTQMRIGCGYVYSSKYIDDDQAVAEMRAAGLDPGAAPRVLTFQPGRFETQWEKNVACIGMSGGFLEPLEATTIHMFYGQIKALTELYLPFYSSESQPVLSRDYNEWMRPMYDSMLDFVSFHYLTGRSDTEFWRDCQRPEAITDRNQHRREMWQHRFPVREDFDGIRTFRFGASTGLLIWAPMLAALGFFRKEHAATLVEASAYSQRTQRNVNRYLDARAFLLSQAIRQREAVKHLRGE